MKKRKVVRRIPRGKERQNRSAVGLNVLQYVDPRDEFEALALCVVWQAAKDYRQYRKLELRLMSQIDQKGPDEVLLTNLRLCREEVHDIQHFFLTTGYVESGAYILERLDKEFLS